MRVLIALLTLVLSFNTVLAQKESSHMKFMGIPMDCCGVKAFAKKLEKEKGLKRIGKPEHFEGLNLEGSFAGYNNCTFLLIGDSKKIATAGVFLPKHEVWTNVYSNYSVLKNKLETKYGEPSFVEESFGEYEPSTDTGKMIAIRDGNANFKSKFNAEGGYITLAIRIAKYYEGYVGYVELGYVDLENSLDYMGKLNDDL